jgi:hypothetical protein
MDHRRSRERDHTQPNCLCPFMLHIVAAAAVQGPPHAIAVSADGTWLAEDLCFFLIFIILSSYRIASLFIVSFFRPI